MVVVGGGMAVKSPGREQGVMSVRQQNRSLIRRKVARDIDVPCRITMIPAWEETRRSGIWHQLYNKQNTALDIYFACPTMMNIIIADARRP